MNNIEFLSLVQQQTNTKPVVVDKAYKDMFLLLHKPDYDISDVGQLSKAFDETIKQYETVEMPTQYESMVHYPGLLKLLDELYSVVQDLGLIERVNPGFNMPLIGTANLRGMQAFAKTDFNTIIIDRSLLTFFSNMGRLLVDLIAVEEEGDCIIRPSLLTLEEIKKRILSDINVIRDFIEIMVSYLKFNEAIPYSHHIKFHNSQKSKLDNLIGFEAWRFIVAHEMMHLLFEHSKSEQSAELLADKLATQICAKCVARFQAETQLYWVPVFVTATLDILRECNEIKGVDSSSHPENRGEKAYHALIRMKAGSFTLAVAEAVRRILLLLWDRAKPAVISLTNNTKIEDLDQMRRVISLIDFTS